MPCRRFRLPLLPLLALLLPLCTLSTGNAARANPTGERPPQLLRIVNNTGADVLNLCFTRQGRTQYVRLDMPPHGNDMVENPGGSADLRVDTGLALWRFAAVPLGKARALTFDSGEPPALTVALRPEGQRRIAGSVTPLLPGPEHGPVCHLDQFRPGMTMREVCALLDPHPPRDDNDAVLTSLGFAGMVWAARLSPGTEDSGGVGTDRLDHMELRRPLDAPTLDKLLKTLYAQGYAPWQAELPGLDMNFTEMTGRSAERRTALLRRTVDDFLAAGAGEATIMLAPQKLLPVLDDADAPHGDVQLFTLTLRCISRTLIVDVAAYQGSEGGR
jgi:hypothetical protein